MTMRSVNNFDTLVEDFKEVTKKPESFLNVDNDLVTSLKNNLKNAYDTAKSEEIKSTKSNSLPELIIKHFDLEQIWQQLELQNDSVLTRSLNNVSKVLVNKEKLLFKNLEDKCKELELSENEEEANEENNENEEKTDSSDDDDDEIDLNKNLLDEESDDSDEVNQESLSSTNKFIKKSVVDDDFFKLDEMEKFLVSEEKKMNDPDSGHDSEESDDEEGSVDLFENISDEEDPMKTAKFKDFFVQKDEEKKVTKRNKFLEDLNSEDDEDREDREVPNNIPKSSLELRQERLNRRIEELEENAVSEKPWQLKGEITAEKRPQNSLLEEIVEFDISTRPAPIITEQTTLQLEDIIKQRIKDKAFDSVERKAKPIETPLEYKKKLVLDQEKSKESLAQIYEKEFLDQQAALDTNNANKDEEESLEHKEIRSLMSTLFNKLDALSNFHFTPKPAIPELKIVSNLPAISMEEVAPVSVSDGALLAPEEVRNKIRGEVLGKTEKTDTDKNRERRKKKQKQKYHAQEKDKKENEKSKNNPQFKLSKEKNKKLLDKITKNTNTKKMDESKGSKSVKSSTAFFTQLQEEVQTHISNKTQKKKTNKQITLSPKKFKL
ncbi:unnamed protein product [Brassicogethes aeneus]|uniref:U3 small nucleolar ribonucleoprotein protein MPP10 n=1 Tax=Brassicogethes aeneus TaxID=1431903 RepID=A0A9P0AZ26_BRAAE|nr:unnamed protein product [Brassicogethes aeneus]